MPAEFLSSDTWNKNELNKSSPRESKNYRGWHTFQLICRCYWNYLSFVVIHFQFLVDIHVFTEFTFRCGVVQTYLQYMLEGAECDTKW